MGGSPAAGQTKLGRFARRPAVGAAIALMVGIALHSSLPDRPEVWLAIATVAAIASVLSIEISSSRWTLAANAAVE